MGNTKNVNVEKVAGSSATADGEHISVGFDVGSGTVLDVSIGSDRAVELIAVLAAALGEAAKNRTRDLNVKYVFSVDFWEIGQQQGGEMIFFSWTLPGGPELTFQIHRDAAERMRETLGMVLGTVQLSAPTGTMRH